MREALIMFFGVIALFVINLAIAGRRIKRKKP
jgi:hypothetical protein